MGNAAFVVLATERYLRGEDLTVIRRELAISKLQWGKWWRGLSGCGGQRRKRRVSISGANGHATRVDQRLAGTVALIL